MFEDEEVKTKYRHALSGFVQSIQGRVEIGRKGQSHALVSEVLEEWVNRVAKNDTLCGRGEDNCVW